jgi:hypothetical protein
MKNSRNMETTLVTKWDDGAETRVEDYLRSKSLWKFARGNFDWDYVAYGWILNY